MKIDDDGKPHAITLGEAQDTIIAHLNDGPRDDGLWISYVDNYGKDRGERSILLEITHASGVCESFQLTLIRDPLG